MCVAYPGRVTMIENSGAPGGPMGKADFSGVAKEICLAYLPDVAIGDYVLVHAGFALCKVDEAEAKAVLADLEELRRLEGT
jgi:hydrogenase expression/formation protein HypC